MTEIPEALFAMDRLNSWLRSDSAKRGWPPTRAVYFLKREAIEWADANLSCFHSSVTTATTCRGCRGTGKYTDSYGEKWPHCRACGSTGRVALLFVQTVIVEAGLTWHTPWMKFYIRGLHKHPPHDLNRLLFDEWSVNQKGREMTPDEVARDLNTVETFWTNRPSEYHTDWGGPFDDFKYAIFVGETPQKCSLCGDASEPYGYRVRRGFVEWTDHACKSCGNPSSRTAFDRFPVPNYLITENVQKFIERRRLEQSKELVSNTRRMR